MYSYAYGNNFIKFYDSLAFIFYNYALLNDYLFFFYNGGLRYCMAMKRRVNARVYFSPSDQKSSKIFGVISYNILPSRQGLKSVAMGIKFSKI